MSSAVQVVALDAVIWKFLALDWLCLCNRVLSLSKCSCVLAAESDKLVLARRCDRRYSVLERASEKLACPHLHYPVTSSAASVTVGAATITKSNPEGFLTCSPPRHFSVLHLILGFICIGLGTHRRRHSRIPKWDFCCQLPKQQKRSWDVWSAQQMKLCKDSITKSRPAGYSTKYL